MTQPRTITPQFFVKKILLRARKIVIQSLGANFVDESTTTWGPGVAVTQSLGGDDYSTGGPESVFSFNYGIDSIVGVNGLTPGDLIVLGNAFLPTPFFPTE